MLHNERSANKSPLWFVASVSDAMRNQEAAVARGSTVPYPPGISKTVQNPPGSHFWPFRSSHNFVRPCSFQVREGEAQLLKCSQDDLKGSGRPQGLTSDSFHVLGRRQTPNNPLLTPELDLDSAKDALDDVASLVQKHLIPNTAALMAVQGEALQHLQKAGRWMGIRPPWHGSKQQRPSSSYEDSSIHLCAEAQRLSDLALQAQKDCNPELAASLYEQVISLQPDADSYARWSKQITDVTYLPHVKGIREQVVTLNTRALEVAEMAIKTDPERPLGHIARCVSRGRLALVSDNKTKVQLAKDAADDAATALQLDPRNDLAHHLMGRWHYEMAQINAIARTLIRLFFGTSLMQGSFSDALYHYRQAAEICPIRVIHRVEIGRTLLKLGDHDGAIQEFTQARDMEIEDINAFLQHQDAMLLLTKLQQKDVHGLFCASSVSSTGSSPATPS